MSDGSGMSMPMPGAGGSGSGLPAQSAPSAPGPGAPSAAPPTGPTGGVTNPVANLGLEAAAMAKLGNLAQQIQMVLAVIPVGSDASRDVRQALNLLSKHIRLGEGGKSGPEMTAQQLAMMRRRQMGQPGQQVAAMRTAAPAGGPVAPPQPS